MFATLYHPSFEPDPEWLRSMLLYYDTVHSIIPDAARGTEYQPSNFVSELRDADEEAFVPISPTEQDRELSSNEMNGLMAALREIRSEDASVVSDTSHATVAGELNQADLALANGARIHSEKLSRVLLNELQDLGLAERASKASMFSINERAADLILSLTAQRMQMSRQTQIQNTSTDVELEFAVSALAGAERSYERSGALLAATTLSLKIPNAIADIPIQDFLEIRKRYSEKREQLHIGFKTLANAYLDHEYRNAEQFQGHLESIAKKISSEIESIQSQPGTMAGIRKWGVLSVGGLVTIATPFFEPTLAAVAATVTLGLQALPAGKDGYELSGDAGLAKAILAEVNSDVRLDGNRWKRLLRM